MERAFIIFFFNSFSFKLSHLLIDIILIFLRTLILRTLLKRNHQIELIPAMQIISIKYISLEFFIELCRIFVNLRLESEICIHLFQEFLFVVCSSIDASVNKSLERISLFNLEFYSRTILLILQQFP